MSSQFQSILLVVVVTVAQTKIKITKDNWLDLTEIAFCEVHNLWVKFRYSEKAINILPIFHLLCTYLTLLSSVKLKVEDGPNFLWHSQNI